MKKRIFRIILIVIALLVVSILVLKIYLGSIMDKSLPDYNNDITLKNINEEVEIYRDQYGVPHIFAKNEEDLYRATGYIMAQDRMWQMDLLRRVTQGRLAEIFPDEMMDVDILFRSMKIEEKSKMIMDSTGNDILKCLTSFADGVNQYLEQNKDKLPVEFKILGYTPEPWKPEHSLNLIGFMAWDLKAGWDNLFLEDIKNKLGEEKRLELLPNFTSQKTYIFSEEVKKQHSEYSKLLGILDVFKAMNIEVLNASNNWCVSGEKSASGKPLLANDMHLGFSIPGTWFQIHQVVEGSVDVSGLALPGEPLVIAGHNEDIAWGLTNTYVDNLDFYEEKVNPENKNQYEFNGKWKDFKVENIVLKNKKGKETIKTVRFSHRGPVISDFKYGIKSTLSMQWIGSLYSNELEAMYKLNRASNWDEFRQAVKGFVSVSQNINYADREGNIGLQCSAGVPIRNRAITSGILPGNTDEYDWKGLLPFEDLPFQYNPENGSVSSANTKTADDSYPYYIGSWFSLPYRLEKIREVLDSKDNFSSGDFMLLQTDNVSKLASFYTPQFIDFIDKSIGDLSKQEKDCFNKLLDWDYSYDANNKGALIFEETYVKILENLVKDEMGDELYTIYISKTKLPRYTMENAFRQSTFSWCDDITTTDKIENLSDIVVKGFKDAVHKIAMQQGGNPDKWEWGAVHRLKFQHPMGKVYLLDKLLKLNKGPFALGGSWHTVGPYSYNFGNPFDIVHGASHRHIYDLSNWDNSLTVIPTGNSGISASEHYADQTDLYINNRYHEDFFTKKRIVQNAKYTCKVEPVK